MFQSDPYGNDELAAVAALLDIRVRDRALMDEVIARLRATVEVCDPSTGGLDLEDALACAEARRARATADAIDAALAEQVEFFKTSAKPPKPKRETPAQKRQRLWTAAYYRNNPTPAPPPTPAEERKMRLMINRATRYAREGKIPEYESLADRLI